MGPSNESEIWDPVLIMESRMPSMTPSHSVLLLRLRPTTRWNLQHLLVQLRSRLLVQTTLLVPMSARDHELGGEPGKR